MPSAPEPQKQSKIVKSWYDYFWLINIEDNVLNMVSFALSEVGRILRFLGLIKSCPLYLPEIILIFKINKFKKRKNIFLGYFFCFSWFK